MRHTRRMFRRSTFATFLWLLAIVLLPLQSANAHVHLCLDGQEPPVSVHVQDVPTHFGAAAQGEGHSDRDVQVTGSLWTKKAGDFDDVPLDIVQAYVIAFVLPVRIESAPDVAVHLPHRSSVFALHPPTRGPPA